MSRPELKITGPGYEGSRFVISENGARLGRSSSNDIVIRDEELSRNHCLFEVSGESGIRLTDLASANGTFVNGTRLEMDAVDLKIGDLITMGKSTISVVPPETPAAIEGKKKVDLGLGSVVRDSDEEPVADFPLGRKRNSPRAMMWIVAIAAVIGAAALLLLGPGKSESSAGGTAVLVDPCIVGFDYEMVKADSESIYRYAMSFASNGSFTVVIDDTSGDGRHVNRSEVISADAKARLLRILRDDGLMAMDGVFSGPDEEPPRLNSWVLELRTGSMCKNVSIINTQEPDVFRKVRERLETFAMNELGIRALQYSRDRLIEMSKEAAALGNTKWEDRDVEYGNLHASICAYQEAMSDLETVNPKPAEYDVYRIAKEKSERELAKRYDNQRFAAEQACSMKDWALAVKELRIICEMIPDRNDERNHEASVKLIDAESRMKKGDR